MTVTYGNHKIFSADAGEKKAANFHRTIHPNRDICILNMIKSLVPTMNTASVQTVCLPATGNMIPVGTKCWSAGWGLTGKQFANVLQEVDLNIMSHAHCSSMRTDFRGVHASIQNLLKRVFIATSDEHVSDFEILL